LIFQSVGVRWRSGRYDIIAIAARKTTQAYM
jgi:hypothetical protein